jgi:hypothetical protein
MWSQTGGVTVKKNQFLGYALLGVLFVLISVIVFMVPTQKAGTFWVTYVFTVLAFAAQPIIWNIALGKVETLKSKFLGLPLLHIGIAYLVIQVIALVVFTAASSVPTWISAVICVLILGISAICMISSETGRSEIEKIETKVQKKVFHIKELQVDVEMMAENESDPQIRTALLKLAEKFHFSDPISSEELTLIEEQINQKVSELKSENDKVALIDNITMLLTERNKKCKLLK